MGILVKGFGSTISLVTSYRLILNLLGNGGKLDIICDSCQNPSLIWCAIPSVLMELLLCFLWVSSDRMVGDQTVNAVIKERMVSERVTIGDTVEEESEIRGKMGDTYCCWKIPRGMRCCRQSKAMPIMVDVQVVISPNTTSIVIYIGCISDLKFISVFNVSSLISGQYVGTYSSLLVCKNINPVIFIQVYSTSKQ